MTVRKALMFCILLPLFSYASSANLQVKTKSGVVEGKATGSVRTFLGIPYAAPPLGDLRWRPPMPAARWSGVRKTTEFGARCMQAPVYGDMVFRDAGGSEDCLSLNVWTPAKEPKSKLPVMVWIYGGGFAAGGTSEPRQDGTSLAQSQNVVVVSMNYRLGIFGFFVHPELVKESGRGSAGNYGLLDQRAALQWVHDNIAGFGGDPGNVTIFGESAGSFSVSAQMASPTTRGLFHKAIGESGGAFFSSGLRFEPLSARATKDSKLAAATLGASTLAELRAVPAQKLLDSFFKPGGGFDFGPDLDGYFLPQSLAEIFAAGKQNDVPMLAGWNHDEGSFEVAFAPQKPTTASLKATAQKDFGDKAADFLKVYSAPEDAQAVRVTEDYAGDKFIAWSTWRWLEAQLRTGKKPIYRYRFDLAPPASDPKAPDLGAFHSAEIEYVFGALDSKANVSWRASDRQLSEQIQKYWANFARTGDPNGASLPQWPVYDAASGWRVMHLDATSEARKDAHRDRYLFLSTVWEK
jgi:para-nitrobenzyl esterase